MIKTISNNNYTIILSLKNKELTYILNDTIEDLKSNDVINWYNFKDHEGYYNNNGDILLIGNIDHYRKIVILEIY